jgi:hypothetical protein
LDFGFWILDFGLNDFRFWILHWRLEIRDRKVSTTNHVRAQCLAPLPTDNN